MGYPGRYPTVRSRELIPLGAVLNDRGDCEQVLRRSVDVYKEESKWSEVNPVNLPGNPINE